MNRYKSLFFILALFLLVPSILADNDCDSFELLGEDHFIIRYEHGMVNELIVNAVLLDQERAWVWSDIYAVGGDRHPGEWLTQKIPAGIFGTGRETIIMTEVYEDGDYKYAVFENIVCNDEITLKVKKRSTLKKLDDTTLIFSRDSSEDEDDGFQMKIRVIDINTENKTVEIKADQPDRDSSDLNRVMNEGDCHLVICVDKIEEVNGQKTVVFYLAYLEGGKLIHSNERVISIPIEEKRPSINMYNRMEESLSNKRTFFSSQISRLKARHLI